MQPKGWHISFKSVTRAASLRVFPLIRRLKMEQLSRPPGFRTHGYVTRTLRFFAMGEGKVCTLWSLMR